MNKKVIRFFFFLIPVVLIGVSGGCVKRISHYNKKKRKIEEIEMEEETSKLSHGSLWTERSTNASLFSERKAHKINDIILVSINEDDEAAKKANTTLGRSSSMDVGLSNAIGIWERFLQRHTDISADAIVKTEANNEFEGSGSTSRNDAMSARLTVTVKKVFKSGNLFIEGEKVILVNDEEQHLYLSGIIRPEDITENNKVASDRIAELQVEFVGRGSLSDKQSPGVLSRLFDWVWPF